MNKAQSPPKKGCGTTVLTRDRGTLTERVVVNRMSSYSISTLMLIQKLCSFPSCTFLIPRPPLIAFSLSLAYIVYKLVCINIYIYIYSSLFLFFQRYIGRT